MGYIGAPQGVALDARRLCFTGVRLHGGLAPVRQHLPHLMQLIWDGVIDPGKVCDLTLPLQEAAKGCRARDSRRAVKVMLTP